jgi:hypothetical protein
MSPSGHSLPIRLVAAWHDVGNAPKADMKFQRNIRRDGPVSDIRRCSKLAEFQRSKLYDLGRELTSRRALDADIDLVAEHQEVNRFGQECLSASF